MDEKPHLLCGFIGGSLGYAIARASSASSFITTRWPSLFVPFWDYMLPIGLVAAAVGGLIAAVMAPMKRRPVTADVAAVIVCVAVSETMLAHKPNLLTLFFVTIGYGFVGHVAGSFAVFGPRGGSSLDEK